MELLEHLRQCMRNPRMRTKSLAFKTRAQGILAAFGEELENATAVIDPKRMNLIHAAYRTGPCWK
jgi:hypothetical protein